MLTALAGCGGSDATADTTGAATSNPKVAETAWEVAPSRTLAVAAGSTFDLAATLPPKVARGGVFEVDPSGAPLPTGITLDRAGMLVVSNAATGGTAGVVFRYTPPA